MRPYRTWNFCRGSVEGWEVAQLLWRGRCPGYGPRPPLTSSSHLCLLVREGQVRCTLTMLRADLERWPARSPHSADPAFRAAKDRDSHPHTVCFWEMYRNTSSFQYFQNCPVFRTKVFPPAIPISYLIHLEFPCL